MRVCNLCEQCQVPYHKNRDVSYKHRHFCSMTCKEDWIDMRAQINGTGEDNPGRPLHDWKFSAVVIDP